MTEEPNWDVYYAKHCARLYGWLPASLEFVQYTNKKNIKYFTLCATNAIDVFMLEMAKVLHRENGVLQNIVICEQDLNKVSEIFEVVRPPVISAIIVGNLQEILTFNSSVPFSRYPTSAQERQRRFIKEQSDRLRREFPFDIINFDPCDSLLNPAMSDNKLCDALRAIFEYQKSAPIFLLLLTTRIDDAAPSEDQFKRDLKDNISQHPEIGKALCSRTGTTQYDDINVNQRIALGVAKSLVSSIAARYQWQCEHKGIHVYENHVGHRFLTAIVQCTRTSTVAIDTYVRDIVNVITAMPQYYSYVRSLGNREVQRHLRQVVEFRDNSHRPQ